MSSFPKVSVLTVLAVVLAGCGGSYAAAPPTTPTNSPHRSAVKPGTKFSIANVSGVGNVVVDARSRTVYILTTAGTKNLPCTDASGCTGLWPDLPLPDGTSAATAGNGIDASLLGTKKLSDGETYPTYNGFLMYEYAGDTGPGQANGQGLVSFGGTWYVLNASGQPVKQSSSGGGYHYP
jgi:predicted lipoprotein with Yx(FWY)xxD motif